MQNKSLLLVAFLLVLAAASAHGQKAKDGGSLELLPPGDGRELVLNSCTGCHDLKVVARVRMSRAEWAKSVNDMIQRGAPVFSEEIEPITTYLSNAFGKSVPQLVNVNTATREDLEQLPNLKPELVTRILAARGKAGPFKNSEELRRALGMEKGDLEKVIYLLKYSD